MIGSKQIKWYVRRMDWWMTLAIACLMVVGVLFIYSAAFQRGDLPVAGLYKRQLMWVILGLASYLGLALFDYRRLGESAWWIYVTALVLLILVLFIGQKVHGAYRWLNLFGIRVQPSEFAKLAVLIALAWFWSRPARNSRDPMSVVHCLILVGVPFFLIFKEPDLGTAAILLPISFVIMYAAGVPLKTLGIIILVALLLLPCGWFALGEYQQERLLVFLDPGRDPLGAGWNKMQSEIAVGSGGLTGKGYLQGSQNVLGFLPRAVAPTDFIYSVIAEEMGFVGSLVILVLYGTVVVAGVRIAIRSRDKFGRLIAVGMVTLLFCHIVVNMAMTIGLMPITGLPLPLISYGGSFMIATMMGLGVLQSIFVRRHGQ